MRYALIDNSSLTAIQRLLGEIPVRNIAIIDSDILSLENYIQAILFYDDIICIDDYKDSYRNKRKNFFPKVRFISKDLFDYEQIVEKADDITKDIILTVKAGQVTDTDFKAYLDRLDMTFQFTWDMASSKFFLTQKMLIGNSNVNIRQFNLLYAALYKEKNEKFEVASNIPNRSPQLYDRLGNKIILDPSGHEILSPSAGDGLSESFINLATSLNWMSQRTAFYVLVAENLSADLFLQPIRQEFLQNIIAKVYPRYKLGEFNKSLNELNNAASDTLSKILSNYDNFVLSNKVPLFSAYLAGKTKNSKCIIEEAYRLREDPSFCEARNCLRKLNQFLESSEHGKFIREINLLVEEIKKSCISMQSKYGLGNSQGISLRFLISKVPILKEFEMSDKFRIKSLEFMKHRLPKSGFNAVYRNIIDDLVVIERLGVYKDILTENIKYHKDAANYSIKQEELRFVKLCSYWKKPMD